MQPKWNIKQFRLAEQLNIMDRKHLFDGFYFDKQAFVDQQIETERTYLAHQSRQRKSRRAGIISVASCSINSWPVMSTGRISLCDNLFRSHPR